MTQLCVYILESQGFYKIGKTMDLRWRVASLQTANPVDLKVAHLIYTEKNATVEAALHTIFSSKRKRGEWFQLSQGDLEVIISMSAEDIINLAKDMTAPPVAKTPSDQPGPSWPLPWETIRLPQVAIIPIKILNAAYEGKRVAELFFSFVLIFNLAWETDYKCTPPVNETELQQYLRLSRRQYFTHKSAMEKRSWLKTIRLEPGMVQFEFDESLLKEDIES